eukprot:53652-Amphidinium_carterae.1
MFHIGDKRRQQIGFREHEQLANDYNIRKQLYTSNTKCYVRQMLLRGPWQFAKAIKGKFLRHA